VQVEGLVAYARRNFMVPIPVFASLNAVDEGRDHGRGINHLAEAELLGQRTMSTRSTSISPTVWLAGTA
jgi:hypothetical protein